MSTGGETLRVTLRWTNIPSLHHPCLPIPVFDSADGIAFSKNYSTHISAELLENGIFLNCLWLFSFQGDSEIDSASWIIAIETAIQIGLGDRAVRNMVKGVGANLSYKLAMLVQMGQFKM